VHTRCTAGDLFGADCRCRETLDESMRMIAEAGCGVILYLHNTSRGFLIEPPEEQATGADPDSRFPQADDGAPVIGRLVHHKELRARERNEDRILREVGVGGQILTDLGIQRIRLLTNSTRHIPALEGFGLEIVEQVPIAIEECARPR
jgi:3,4-dihydroxy 2-butanone 4-phosphate synthase/GTP cyclohydrolase II